jgi:hypothetical protein
MKAALLIIVAGVLLCSCSPNPKDVAEGERIKLIAAQQSENMAQARSQQQAKWNIDQATRKETAAQWTSSMTTYISAAMFAATVATVFVLLGAGVGGGTALAGIGYAVAQGARLKANLIMLDKSTNQYPLLRYDHKGMVSLTDSNTGQTLLLDTRHDADRQLIASSGAVRLAGIVSHNAASHRHDPAGVALVGTNPVIVYDNAERTAREE